MRKPLYLDGTQPLRVVLDGPSLLVLAAHTAPRRFPLARISRILVTGQVTWENEALTACLDHGVPLTFLSPDGTARGFALPSSDPATPDNEKLEAFLAQPDWRSRYTDWLRAYERREILSLLRQLQLRTRDLRPEPVRELVESHLTGQIPLVACRTMKNLLDGMLAGRLARHLVNLAWAPALLVDRQPGFHFIRDAVTVLGWRFYADIERFLHVAGASFPHQAGLEVRARLATAYENLAPREDRRIRHYCESFRFWVGGFLWGSRRRT